MLKREVAWEVYVAAVLLLFFALIVAIVGVIITVTGVV